MLVQAVKVHAARNYNCDGWDYVVESCSDAEILEIITKANAKTEAEAIKAVHAVVVLWDEIRQGHQNEADAGR